MCAREVTLRAKSGDIYGQTRLSQRETGAKGGFSGASARLARQKTPQIGHLGAHGLELVGHGPGLG